MSQNVKLRLLGVAVSVIFLMAGVASWLNAAPRLFVWDGPDIWSRTLVVGFLPFWGASCLVVGSVALALVLSVGDLRHILTWSAAVMGLLWIGQFSGVMGLYLGEPGIEKLNLIERPASISARWWAIMLLIGVLVVVAFWSRTLASREEPPSRAGAPLPS